MTAQAPKTSYDRDYLLWLEMTIEQLKQRRFNDLDLENLIEELEGMARSDKRAIKSLLTVLLQHLLKLAYWETEREQNANHWQSEIIAFRNQIQELIEDSPSLKPYLKEIFPKCYSAARESLSVLKGMQKIPMSEMATLEQVLDKDWFPITQN